jgi:hypothetical protein
LSNNRNRDQRKGISELAAVTLKPDFAKNRDRRYAFGKIQEFP